MDRREEKEPPQGRTRSPLWHRAVERYREELAGSEDYEAINEISSLEDLLDYAKTMEPILPRERNTLSSMRRLGPTLKFVDDFAAMMAVCFGADAKLTALVWGSIRLMLTLASSAGDTLKEVLDMLEELSFTLPRFRSYEENLPMDRSLEAALVDVYAEVICFYARCIHFFRTHPHVLLRRDAWDDFREDFSQTVRRIKRMSSIVETEAESVRMRQERSKYGEVIELMETLRDTKLQDEESENFYVLPSQLNPRFWGREDLLQEIDDALKPSLSSQTLKTFAICGMGGVGKTQIALTYANRNRNQYKAIFWVDADNVINMGNSFLGISQVLGQDKGDEPPDTSRATLQVKKWLLETNHSWLLIFDNADDLEVLRHAWPANGRGSVLLTTRDSASAYNLTGGGCQVQPFDNKLGSQVLLSLLALDSSSAENQKTAAAISETLGGLPLALNQIGGFMRQRRMALADFLPLYERNAAKIDARKIGMSDYEHTVSTVWQMSLTKLSGDSQLLLHLFVYLQPDAIDESVLLQGSHEIEDPEFDFLKDEIDLGDAEEILLSTSLIDKSAISGTISVHRLLQAAVGRSHSQADKARYFDLVVKLLTWGFPDTWSQDIGHQFGNWFKCEKCLPHVHQLVSSRDRRQIPLLDPQKYAELLLRCSWYLYEREQYGVAKRMVSAALAAFNDTNSLAYASAIDLQGLVDLDLNDPTEALVSFNTALKVREQLTSPNDPLVASSLNNVALAYTEMDKLDDAHELHQRAIEIRLKSQQDRVGNSYSNMSSLLLKMGKADAAEEMLARCPSLKDFTDETFLKTGNPRFSGDMVLLSRIRRQQGRVNDALRLASKALAFRQKLLGNKLKTCDSLYDVACLMHNEEKTASAIELLEQLVNVAGALPEGKGQIARAHFKLAGLYSERDRATQSQSSKETALKLRSEIRPDLGMAPFVEVEFNKLCLWMLW